MKRLLLTSIFFLALTGFVQTAFSQGFPYHLYDTRTLAELNELNLSIVDPNIKTKTQLMISAKPFYSAIRFEYLGKYRKISKGKKGLFRLWVESLNVKGTNTNKKIDDLIETEYLFMECDKMYWIPVQTPAAKDFPKDFKEGDRITLYLMMVGGIRVDNGDWDFIYLTSSFRNIQSPREPKKASSVKKTMASLKND